MMIDVDNLTKKSLAALLDSTFLKAFGGPEKIDDLCREAAEFGFASVAVNGCEVARCAAMLKGSGVKVTAVAGFPLGQMTTDAKLFEVRDVIAQGAGEVDIVQNVRRLQAGDAAYVLVELAEFAKICRGEGVTSKVIISCKAYENCNTYKRSYISHHLALKEHIYQAGNDKSDKSHDAEAANRRKILLCDQAVKGSNGKHCSSDNKYDSN